MIAQLMLPALRFAKFLRMPTTITDCNVKWFDFLPTASLLSMCWMFHSTFPSSAGATDKEATDPDPDAHKAGFVLNCSRKALIIASR